MKFLDLDLDFFQMDIANWVDDCGERLSSEFTEPWNKEKVVMYLEKNLGLKKSSKVKGRIYRHHNEVFYFWRELIENGSLSIPFEVVHVDAHADLGMGDSSFQYITTEYLYLSDDEKIYPENLICNKYNKNQFSCGNYLIFALACNWINRLDYVLHFKNTKGNDYSRIHFKNYDINTDTIQIKKYEQYEELGVGGGRKIEENAIIELGKEIPLRCLKQDDAMYNGEFDFVGLSISPGYTVREADELIEVIREYIYEI